MAGDDVRRLSDELARDPSSLAFLQLGEILRRQGQLEMAVKVAIRGLERHSHNPEAHDLLARIEADRGETQKAFDEWDMALRLAPGHAGANRGMGFLCYTQGDLAEAEQYFAAALAGDPEDEQTAAALEHVRNRMADAATLPRSPVTSRESPVEVTSVAGERDTPLATSAGHSSPATGDFADSRNLFADLTADGRHNALLLDASGLVMAGSYVTPDGRDAGQEIGAHLSGVSDEARRAMRHLDLGDWSSIVLETDGAIVAMAPAAGDGLLLVTAERTTPLGYVRRELERAGTRVREWIEGEAR